MRVTGLGAGLTRKRHPALQTSSAAARFRHVNHRLLSIPCYTAPGAIRAYYYSLTDWTDRVRYATELELTDPRQESIVKIASGTIHLTCQRLRDPKSPVIHL